MHKENTTPAKNDDQKIREVLKNVKNRLLVFSGKGGVGKSTVAANLAMALSEKGLKVGLLDVDIHGPNLVKMLGAEDRRVEMREEQIIPVNITPNLKLVSMAFFLEKLDVPVVWRGPLKMKVIRQFIEDVAWGDLDWLICDSPPGTGDEPLSVASLIPATAAVIVTTPQEVSLLDSRKAVNFAHMLKLKILGIIENMSGFVCPHCGEKTDLFKSGGGEVIAREYNIPFLGRIPIDPHIVESGDMGQPFVHYRKESEAAKAFAQIVEKIIK
ncbi:MAG: Iron-sulfur cluster carrier protein [Acidobacteriota bacterium]|nr:Iron-sulfur cluster carrier protein [Acidobacteriota bacterium]